MSLPNVVININANGLGGVSSDDYGIVGFCGTGVAVADKLVLNMPYYIYNLDGAKALGVTEAGVNDSAYRHIKEFYDVAGDGAKLWFILSADTVKLADMVDKSETICPAKILIDAAGGEIKALAASWKPASGYVPVITTGIESEVIAAITNAQVLADDYLAKVMPVVIILEGLHYGGNSGELLSLRTKTNPRVSVVLCSTIDDNSASVGLVLGRIAKIPVMRSIARVKNGALPIDKAYLSDGETLESHLDDLATIHDKGYIVFRKFPRKAGYYFNDDATAVAVSNDLCQIGRVRTIDKAVVIAYDTYVDEIGDEIFVNADGTMDAALIKSLQAKIENNVTLQMSGEISGLNVLIDPLQNILSTNKLAVVLRITPVGVMKEITVDLGFTNPALQTA